MKLEFGNNLKRMRRERDMTQEDLANALSISVQAISRYETGTTYPDIEMLPVFAGYFGVTVDMLLGTSQNGRKKRKDEYAEQLGKITDVKERLALLRLEHAEFPESWDVVNDMLYAMTSLPECLEEARKITEDSMLHCNEIIWRENIMMYYLQIEPDEDKALAFIHKWASKYDMEKPFLLRLYYRQHGDTKKEQPLIQKMLADHLTESLWTLAGNADTCEEILSFLDRITGQSDDTAPDMWFNLKWKLHAKISDNAFACGNREKGYAEFEKLVSLTEKMFSLSDGTVLSYHVESLNLLNAETEKATYLQKAKGSDSDAHYVMMKLRYLSPIAPLDPDEKTIRDMEGFETMTIFTQSIGNFIHAGNMHGFNSVKGEERFVKLSDRIISRSEHS